jgi:hypothetical protein
MKKLFLILFLSFAVIGLQAQSKKEIKANKIKSTTTYQADNSNGTAVTYKDQYDEFDKDGRTTKHVEYNSDGSIKRQETTVYDANGNKTEETEYDVKDNINTKKVSKYNVSNDKTEEAEYNGSGTLLKTTVYTYNANGDKTGEIVTDATGNILKKIVYTYDVNGLKLTKQTYNAANILESVKKFVYGY